MTWLRTAEKHYKRAKKLRDRLDAGRYSKDNKGARNLVFTAELKLLPTPAEKVFGDYLFYELGIRFRFQKGFFVPFHRIMDFYIRGEKHLGVEIDGSSHDGKEEKDLRKDKMFLDQRGIKVYRFRNEDIYSGKFKESLHEILKKHKVKIRYGTEKK
jgi:very-short-patch-repair endonuclease